MCHADLEHAEAAGAAASAIRDVCHSCGRYLAASYLDGLMQLYQKVQGQGAAAPAGAQTLAEQDVVAVSFPPSCSMITISCIWLQLQACAVVSGTVPCFDTVQFVSEFGVADSLLSCVRSAGWPFTTAHPPCLHHDCAVKSCPVCQPSEAALPPLLARSTLHHCRPNSNDYSSSAASWRYDCLHNNGSFSFHFQLS